MVLTRKLALLLVGFGLVLVGVKFLLDVPRVDQEEGEEVTGEAGTKSQGKQQMASFPLEDPLQYGPKWEERSIITIDSSPPSGAEITFRITDEAGRSSGEVLVDFVGYDELDFLRRKIMGRKQNSDAGRTNPN